MTLPGVGKKVAEKILEMRESNRNLVLDDLRQVPYLKLTPQLLSGLDFSPLQTGEGSGDRRESLDHGHRERVRSVDQLLEEWGGAGQGHPQGLGKDGGQQVRGPPTTEKPYPVKQEGEWWQRTQPPTRVEDDYGELDSVFGERQAPDSEERERANVQDPQNRPAGMGYAYPREQGLFHRKGTSRQRGNETHDYSRDMHGPGMQARTPAYREYYWQDRGGRQSPPRTTGGEWFRDQSTPLTRESRERAMYTPGRERDTPRGLSRREEGERGQFCLGGGDLEAPRGRNPYTPLEAESGCRPRYTETPRGYGRREEFEGERAQRGRSKSVNLPKSLKFDGKSNWKAFYAKFSRYAEVSEWSEGECRDQLCWCLDGKASEYYALMVERNHEMPYRDLLGKLEKRFGFRELPETAQVQFSNARQTPEELLEDWADRVLSLATRAFRELPETHMYQQAVVRFCQGAADKEAGSYASNTRPSTMDDAIDKMRWHQHNHQAIYGRPSRKEVKQVSPRGGTDSGEAKVCVVGANRGEESSLGREVREIKTNLAVLSAQMAGMMEELKRGRSSGYRTPPGALPPEGTIGRDVTTVGRWDISKGSAQNIWGHPGWKKRCLFRTIRGL